MVEERKSEENLNPSGYQDLMDLIYTGDHNEDRADGSPTVIEDEYTNARVTNGRDSIKAEAIPFVTLSASGEELEISTEAMSLLDGM